MSWTLRGARTAFAWVWLLAICDIALVSTPAAAGCQSGDNQDLSKTFNLNSIICNSVAEGDGALAVGELAWALGARATSLGHYAAQSSGTVEGATSVGARANINSAGVYATALGAGKNATGPNSQGNFSVAIGGGDGRSFTPSGGSQINLNGAKATGLLSAAVGTASQAGGGASAFGAASNASGSDSVALGDFSTAAGAGGIAGGLFSSASASGSIAIGRHAQSTKPGAIALGENSLANVANTVSVGTNAAPRRIMNVSPAIAVRDAVNLGQVKALIAAAATPAQDLHGQLKELRDLVYSQQAHIARLEARLSSAAK